MDQKLFLNIFFCAVALPNVIGFTCYKCSYVTQTEGSRRDCIENPSALGFGSHLECNSTSYCVLQEQYDIHKKLVTSYFRSCSGKSWGNECNKDWSHVTCKASCQGNYCNERDQGKRYEAYLALHKDDHLFDSGTSFTTNIYLYMSMIFVGRYIQWKIM
ncbi:uncharacterized protein LOC123561713 [Mercenaria mercenaria]|uniref:uncharacterized protein LOC123561713 n=1 Tax=Mercenaria mercenaria TaxID=6596 RepID=UPI00234ECE4E|nr:uncharacterized protein LOC123561713 [Mercenaria mercenaria]